MEKIVLALAAKHFSGFKKYSCNYSTLLLAMNHVSHTFHAADVFETNRRIFNPSKFIIYLQKGRFRSVTSLLHLTLWLADFHS